MNGDFDEDDLSDISDDEEGGGGRKRRRKNDKLKTRKKQKGESGGDDLGDSDDDDDNKEDENEVRFTADGLVYIDKQGNVVGKVGEENQDEDEDEETSSENEESDGSDEDGSHSEPGTDSDDSEEEEYDNIQFTKGMKVQGNYHASEQYQGKENWYDGTITGIRKDDEGNTVYDVTYDDGDFEEGMDRENVRPIPLSKEEKDQQKTEESEAAMVKKKKQKAKLRAK
jgi:nucleolar protein 14